MEELFVKRDGAGFKGPAINGFGGQWMLQILYSFLVNEVSSYSKVSQGHEDKEIQREILIMSRWMAMWIEWHLLVSAGQLCEHLGVKTLIKDSNLGNLHNVSLDY